MLRSKKWLIGILAAILLICAALSLAFLPGPATEANADPEDARALPDDVAVTDITGVNYRGGVTADSTYDAIKGALTVTVTGSDAQTYTLASDEFEVVGVFADGENTTNNFMVVVGDIEDDPQAAVTITGFTADRSEVRSISAVYDGEADLYSYTDIVDILSYLTVNLTYWDGTTSENVSTDEYTLEGNLAPETGNTVGTFDKEITVVYRESGQNTNITTPCLITGINVATPFRLSASGVSAVNAMDPHRPGDFTIQVMYAEGGGSVDLPFDSYTVEYMYQADDGSWEVDPDAKGYIYAEGGVGRVRVTYEENNTPINVEVRIQVSRVAVTAPSFPAAGSDYEYTVSNDVATGIAQTISLNNFYNSEIMEITGVTYEGDIPEASAGFNSYNGSITVTDTGIYTVTVALREDAQAYFFRNDDNDNSIREVTLTYEVYAVEPPIELDWSDNAYGEDDALIWDRDDEVSFDLLHNYGNGSVTYTYININGGEPVTGTAENPNLPNVVGEYNMTVTVAANGNFTGATLEDIHFTIGQRVISIPTLNASTGGNLVYNGAPQTAEITYQNSGDAEYLDVTNVGGTDAYTYTVTFTIKDEYADEAAWDSEIVSGNGVTVNGNTLTLTYEITKLSIAVPSFGTGGTITTTYQGTPNNGTAQTQGLSDYAPSAGFAEGITSPVTVTISGNAPTSADSVNGTVTATNAGTYTVIVSLGKDADKQNLQWDGGSTDDLTFYYIIEKATVEVPDAGSKPYNGEAQISNLTGMLADEEISGAEGEIRYYSVAHGSDWVNADTYEVTLKLIDSANYKWVNNDDDNDGMIAVNFTITPLVVAVEWDENSLTTTYNGQSYKPTANISNKVEGDDVSFVISGAQTDAGENYTAIITDLEGNDAGNYTLTDASGLSQSFNITPRVLTGSWGELSHTYDGTSWHPVFTPNNVLDRDSITLVYDGAEINAGDDYEAIVEDITGTGAGNYTLPEGGISTTFDITQLMVVVDWDEDSLTTTYSPDYINQPYAPSATVSNRVGDDEVYFIISGAQTNAGVDYTATITDLNGDDAGNYTISGADDLTIPFTITRAQLTRPTADTTVFTYTGSEFTYNPVGFNSATMTINGNVQTDANESGYEVNVSITDKVNYEWSTEVNGENQDDITFSFVINKWVVDVPVLSGGYLNEGRYFEYNNGNPLTPGVTENAEIYSITFEDEYSSDFGTYHIYFALLHPENYEWAELTDINDSISADGVTITMWYSITKTQYTFEIDITGWQFGAFDEQENAPAIIDFDSLPDQVQSANVTYTYYLATDTEFIDGSASRPTDVGDYVVVATIAETTNYASVDAQASFSITAAELTVTPTGYSGTYDAASHNALESITVKGMADDGTNWGEADIVSYTIKYSTSENGVYSTEPPQVRNVADEGTIYFRITDVANHEDYSGSFTVTITQAEVEVIWNAPGTITYNGSDQLLDDENHDPVVTASVNLLGDDGQNISLAVSVQGGGEFKNANAEGENYTLEASFGSNVSDDILGNYGLTAYTNTYTIERLAVTIVAEGGTSVYGEDPNPQWDYADGSAPFADDGISVSVGTDASDTADVGESYRTYITGIVPADDGALTQEELKELLKNYTINGTAGELFEGYTVDDENGYGGAWTITARPISVAITTPDGYEYSGENQYVGVAAGAAQGYAPLTGDYAPQFNVAYTFGGSASDEVIHAGSYTYSITVNSNYQIVSVTGTEGTLSDNTVTGSFDIAPHTITSGELNWDGTTFTYNGENQAPSESPLQLASFTGKGDDGTIRLVTTPDRDFINAGAYTFTATALVEGDYAASDYELPETLTHDYTMQQRTVEITIGSVGGDGSVEYGDELPAFSWNYSGNSTGDSDAQFVTTDGDPAEFYTLSANVATEVIGGVTYITGSQNDYTITATVVEDYADILANYSVQITDGTLTVSARAIKVQVGATSSIYGQPETAISYTITEGSIYTGDDESEVFTLTAGVTADSDVGEYNITLNNLKKGYYAIGYNTGNYLYNVTPATITDAGVDDVTGLTYNARNQFDADELNKSATTVNDEEPAWTFSTVYDAEGEGYSETLDLTGAGTYCIYYKITADNHSDYISSDYFTVTIGKATLNVTVTGSTTYGENAPSDANYEIGVGENELQGTDRIQSIGLEAGTTFTISHSYEAGDNAGTYVLTLTDNTNGEHLTNYTIIYVQGRVSGGEYSGSLLTVNQREITLQIADIDVDYGYREDLSVALAVNSPNDLYTTEEPENFLVYLSVWTETNHGGTRIDDDGVVSATQSNGIYYICGFDNNTGIAANYAITFIEGTYTIGTSSLPITIGTTTFTYDGYTKDVVIGINATDRPDINVDEIDLTKTYYVGTIESYDSDNPIEGLPIDAGTYVLVVGERSGNYVVSGATIEVNINPAIIEDVSLDRENFIRSYNGNDWFDDITGDKTADLIESDVNGKVNEVDWLFSLTGEENSYTSAVELINVLRDINNDPAAYTVYFIIDADNHELCYGQFTVFINPHTITIDWAENDFTYNGTQQTVTATYDSFEADDIALEVSPVVDDSDFATFVNAGNYKFRVSFADGDGGSSNYELPLVATNPYTMKAASVEVALQIPSQVYTGETFNTLVGEKGADYTVSGDMYSQGGIPDDLGIVITINGAAGATDVDSYDVTATWDNDNYSVTFADGTFNGAFVITAADITQVSVSDKVFEYSGASRFDEAVADISASTVDGTDATWTYSLTDGSETGEGYNESLVLRNVLRDGDDAVIAYTVYYKITADNHADYYGQFEVTINPAEVSVVWCDDDFTYTGSDQSGSVTAYYVAAHDGNVEVTLDTALTDGGEFTDVNGGADYSFTATFAGDELDNNYSLASVTADFHIKKAELVLDTEGEEFAWVDEDNEDYAWIYGDTDFMSNRTSPVAELANNGNFTITEGEGQYGITVEYFTDEDCLVPFEGEFSSATNAGVYYARVTVPATDNYGYGADLTEDLVVIYSFEVEQKAVSLAWSPNSEVFDGNLKTSTLKYQSFMQIGEESGTGPDSSTVDFTFTNNAGEHTATMSATSVGTYGVTVTLDDENGANYKWSIYDNDDDENNDGTRSFFVSWSITSEENGWEVTLSITEWTYGEYDDSINYPEAGAVYGEVEFYFTAAGASEPAEGNYNNLTHVIPQNAGTYWVVAVVEGTTDYGSLWATEQFTIHQATVEAPVMPAGVWNYTGDALSVTLGIDNGLDLSIMAISSMSDGLSASADGQSRTFSAVNAGSYDIGISLTNSNYTWAGDVAADENGVVFLTWTITRAVNSWTEELSIVGWTYGQAPSAPAAASMYGEVVFTYYQFVDGEYVAVEAPGYLTGAGTYYVTAQVAGSGNYGALPETGYYEFDILKADYSQSDIEAIIWSNTVVGYTGQPQSPIAVNLPAGLDGITLGYEVEERTDADTYNLTVTFSTSSPNYNVPSDGTVEFEITAKVVAVDWCEDNFTYNGENQSGYVAATYTDINGDEQPLEISVSGGEFIYVNEDGYTFTAAMPEGVTNYVLPEDASAVFHILPAEVTVTIGNQSATYTGSDLSGELDDSMYDVTAGKVYNDDLEITLYITSGEAVAAGPYTIGGTSANANYSVTFIPGVFMVEGLGIEVEITPGGGTFGGEITEATAEVVGGTPDGVTLVITYTGRANDGTEYVNSESAPTQAGTYTVRVTVGGNTNYYISGIDVATMIIARAYVQLPDIDSKPYNGSAQTADIADNALYTFEQGDDWIDAGSYEVVFTLEDSGNYRWESASGDTATAIFEITRAEISVTAPVVPSPGQQYTYGDTISPNGSTVLSDGQTVTFAQPYYVYSADPNSGYTAAVPTEVGVYYVRAAVAATDNYSGATSAYVMFEIVRAEVKLPELEYETSVYDGTEQTNILSGYISSAMAIDIGSLTATTVESGLELRATVVGVYKIAITLNDSHNYVWAGGEDTLTLTWKITQATENAVTVTVTGGGTVYGNALEVVVGAAFGEDAATLAWYADNNGERGELLTGQPTDAGTYWVVATIEDTENYVGGEGSAQFTITPAQVTAPVFSGEDVSYDGEAHTASVSGVNTSLMDIDSESTLVYSGGSWIITETDAAEYTITVSLLDTHNYVWADGEQIGTSNDIVFTWTISQGENEWTEELSIEGWTYGQTPGSPSAEAKFGEVEFTYYEYEGGVRGDEITPDRLTPAGSYLVVATVEGNSNFAGLETELEFVVEKADYDISGITWSNTAVKYTGQPQSPVAGNLPAGLDGIMLGYEVGSATNAGTYTLTVTFSNSSPNYNVPASTTVEFVISRLAVSADWCEDDFTYTGYDQSGSVTATYTDVFGNEHELEVTLTSADEFINVNASGYTFTATFMSGDAASVNYLLGNATAVFHIRAAQVRLNINPGGGTYGGVITPATATVVGAEGVAVSITYSGTANDGTVYSNSTAVPTQAGSYTVRATISDTNYTVVGGNTAVMVIERATVAVPDAGSKTYTGNPLTSDLASNSRYSVEQGDDWINVGEYEVTLTLTDPYNYRWENGDGTATAIFRITRAGNSVTPPEVEDVYAYGDEIVPTGSVALHGTVYYVFSADEDFSEYSLTAPTAVGVYYVRAMVDATANYEGCVSEGVRFEIVSAVVAVPELDFTSSVFDGSEQFNAISGADTAIMDITADCEIVTDGGMGLSAANAGTYTVTFTLKDGISYAFSNGGREVTLTWTISRMALEKPAADDSYFMENGDPLTYMPEGFDEELMNIVGNVQDAAGEYIVSVTLADPDNYVWADGTTDPVIFTFTVDANYLWLIILLSVLLILAIIALVVLAVLLAKRRNNKSDDDPEGGTPANGGAYGFALLAASPLITSTAQIWICVGLGIALAVVIAIDIVLAVKLKKAAASEGNAEAAAAGDAEGAAEGNAVVTAGDNAEGAEAGVEAAEEGNAEAAEESGNEGADSQ